MQLKVHRIDDSLPMPEYQSSGAAAFDLYAREESICPAKSVTRIPTNLVVEIPAEHSLIIDLRSSTPKRKGLLHPAGSGIVDPDYCGPEDEIHVQVYNFTDTDVTIERGERFAQAMLVAAPRLDFVESAPSKETSRGGFGSTGH